MTKSLYATFDGHVFTPEEDIDLLPNKRYLISIETQPSQKLNEKGKVLQRIAARAKDLGISDLAAQHEITCKPKFDTKTEFRLPECT